MTRNPPPQSPQPRPWAVFVNLFGLLLVLAGIGAVVAAAWLYAPLVGLAASGGAATAVGLWLATSEG